MLCISPASLKVTGMALRTVDDVAKPKTSVLPMVAVEVVGKVIATWAFALIETLPAASFAHA
ncbi:hypothetical protein MASR2M47_37030 [Draconibacterium sp.]